MVGEEFGENVIFQMLELWALSHGDGFSLQNVRRVRGSRGGSGRLQGLENKFWSRSGGLSAYWRMKIEISC